MDNFGNHGGFVGMNVSCSMKGIVDITHPEQGLQDISQSGFSDLFLDLSAFASEYELENFGKQGWKKTGCNFVIKNPEELTGALWDMQNKWSQAKLNCRIGMVPYLLRETKRSDLNGLQKQLAEESIIACGKIGCKYLIVRPLFAGIAEEDLWELNQEYYLSLAKIAKEHNVVILLENQCKSYHGHLVRGICSDETMAAEWVDRLNMGVGEDRFGFCLNVGTGNLCGQNMYDFVLTLGKRIKAVILCDCNGSQENALLPFSSVNRGQSQTDWLNVVRGLRKIGFDGELVLNASDTARAFSPILRPAFLQLAKATADYFKWQIEMENLLKKYSTRVLFGAGNMCRNYMKCYGEEYPPLYTCDNNKAVWGTNFCGLEVKSPESLMDLPENCVIFICNIYYREIKKQLQDMGVKNPIEFFNDEYMPDFYFDRLESRGTK